MTTKVSGMYLEVHGTSKESEYKDLWCYKGLHL